MGNNAIHKFYLGFNFDKNTLKELRKILMKAPLKNPKDPHSFKFYMEHAYKLAILAKKWGEVPVGAIITNSRGDIIGEGYNQRETLNQSTAHAEILAINKACQNLNSWRLTDCTLYVTLEPCPMCVGAIWASQLKTVIFAAFDPKSGYAHSLYQLGKDQRLNHQFESIGGVMQESCSQLLKEFFKDLRTSKKKSNAIVHNLSSSRN